MNEILVSTITPCFRMKRYLKRFLEELPNQTMFNQLEIVLDHNEPDEEEISWVKDFQKRYPGRIKHIIVNKVDPIGISMNRCIREASGEFLAIWNVDDLRTENSLELQYKKLVEMPDAGVVYGDFMIVRSFGLRKGSLVNCSRYNEKDFFRSMVFGPYFMFRKSLCDKAGYFDEQLKSGADFDFSLKLAFNSRAVYAEGLLGYYLNEGLGASTRPNSVQALERTVIELRYGIYDKLDYDLVALATRYDIRNCLLDKKLISIGDYINGYENLLNGNKKLINKGVRAYIFKKIMMFKKIRKILKYIKNIIS
jgi:glycosyltransferase involved in cell wall biosynthesis